MCRMNHGRSMPLKVCCMTMRMSIDCNACCRKLRRIILNMKEIETHLIEKPHSRVSVCGRLRPSDVAIKLRKKMNRRVEILEIEELDSGDEHVEQNPPVTQHNELRTPMNGHQVHPSNVHTQ
ncbi:uncharacterized protein LOC115756507 isoform X2 [Rhodamnia argentea]|uniref:Uncharacterized protein LOC115756507 isoform X2 n=1 Tax=Rhodamnia argentea TaxID=178133 RepID=A0A8B8QY87_9MYRT|nr:uncharacterized protein LOC115756507 isoform X2 [Rhodamnia argentea]